MNVEQIIKARQVFFDIRLFNVLGMFGQLGAAGMQAAANTAMNSATNAANERIAKDTNDANIKMTEKTNQMNYLINERTNALNKQIADDANQLNYKMFQEQNDWNLNMWEKNNEYNSPEQQMQRLMEAGINPNMMGSAVGGSAAGNSGSPADGATWSGAETATMNPIQLEAAHIDPYKLFPNQVDFLPALAQAAGVADMQASTNLKKQEFEFNPREYEDEHEMKVAMIQGYLEQTKDLKLTRRGRIRQAYAAAELYKTRSKEIADTLQMRKDEWEWSKSLREDKKNYLHESVNKIRKEVDSMDDQIVLNEALRRHWINQDAYNNKMANIAQQNADTAEAAVNNRKRVQDSQIQFFRNGILMSKIDKAFELYHVRPETRHKISAALAQSGEEGIAQFFEGLDGAADYGRYNNIFKRIDAGLNQLNDWWGGRPADMLIIDTLSDIWNGISD